MTEDQERNDAQPNNDDVRKAKAALLDSLEPNLHRIAEVRSQLDEAGAPMPDSIRQALVSMRQTLRDAGLSEAEVDANPELALP